MAVPLIEIHNRLAFRKGQGEINTIPLPNRRYQTARTVGHITSTFSVVLIRNMSGQATYHSLCVQ